MDKFQDVKIRLLQSDGTSSDAQKTFNLELKVVDQMTLLKARTGMNLKFISFQNFWYIRNIIRLKFIALLWWYSVD